MTELATGQGWHVTYEDYLDTFLTADDAFFWGGDLDSARALVEAGLRGGAGGGSRSSGGGDSANSSSGSAPCCSPSPGGGGRALSRRAWTLARRRAAALRVARPPRALLPLSAGAPRGGRSPPRLLLLSDACALPADECPLLRLLALRERAVRSGSLAVVVFLRARNRAGQECSAYVDLAARLLEGGGGGNDGIGFGDEGRDDGDIDGDDEDEGLGSGGGGGGNDGGNDGIGFDDEGHDDEECFGSGGGSNDDDDDEGEQTAAEELEEEEEDDGDEDAAERRAAAADRRARDAGRGMAGVFARLRPLVPLPTDLSYYNHATRRALANPTAQWQVAPSFGDGGGEDGGGGGGGGRLLLRHVRDRRVLDVGCGEGGGGTSARTVVDLSSGGGGGGGALAGTAGGSGDGGGGGVKGAGPLLLSERSYLLQAVVFDHVLRRR